MSRKDYSERKGRGRGKAGQRLNDVATPIGHALAGYAIYTACGSSWEGRQRHLMVLIIIVALLPDVDLIPGIVMGRPATGEEVLLRILHEF